MIETARVWAISLKKNQEELIDDCLLILNLGFGRDSGFDHIDYSFVDLLFSYSGTNLQLRIYNQELGFDQEIFEKWLVKLIHFEDNCSKMGSESLADLEVRRRFVESSV